MQCGYAVLRGELKAHKATTCPRRTVPCPNAKAGCAKTLPADEMPNHVNTQCK